MKSGITNGNYSYDRDNELIKPNNQINLLVFFFLFMIAELNILS